jgi:hypothetical protein
LSKKLQQSPLFAEKIPQIALQPAIFQTLPVAARNFQQCIQVLSSDRQ